jgi:hypothetical protein
VAAFEKLFDDGQAEEAAAAGDEAVHVGLRRETRRTN